MRLPIWVESHRVVGTEIMVELCDRPSHPGAVHRRIQYEYVATLLRIRINLPNPHGSLVLGFRGLLNLGNVKLLSLWHPPPSRRGYN